MKTGCHFCTWMYMYMYIPRYLGTYVHSYLGTYAHTQGPIHSDAYNRSLTRGSRTCGTVTAIARAGWGLCPSVGPPTPQRSGREKRSAEPGKSLKRGGNERGCASLALCLDKRPPLSLHATERVLSIDE